MIASSNIDGQQGKYIIKWIGEVEVNEKYHFQSKNPPNKSLHWTAQARFLLKGCSLQKWLKFEVFLLAELVYNQAGVCTSTLKSGGVSVGQPVNLYDI